jgi:hypothetical protein
MVLRCSALARRVTVALYGRKTRSREEHSMDSESSSRQGTGPVSVATSTPLTGEVLSIDEVDERYCGEWVELRITAYNEYHQPSHGIVVAHDPDARRCVEGKARARETGALPRDAPLAFFHASPHVRTGAEMLAALKRLAEEWPEGKDPFRWPRV